MFAILITEENLPKIEAGLHDSSEFIRSVRAYVPLKADWYAIRGYVSTRGRLLGSTVLPAYLFEKEFDYDPVKIKKEWDQIVRK